MIGSISGILDEINDNQVLIDCNGVGYEIMVSQTTLSKLGSIGDKVKIYTYLNVNSRDNELALFGFSSREEKNMFLNLTSVSGIGPKTAITILGSISLFDLATAISNRDASIIGSVKGIGKKTAERIILELREKIEKTSEFKKVDVDNQSINSEELDYAINVLLTLGLKQYEATKKVRELYQAGDKAEDIIQKVLKSL